MWKKVQPLRYTLGAKATWCLLYCAKKMPSVIIHHQNIFGSPWLQTFNAIIPKPKCLQNRSFYSLTCLSPKEFTLLHFSHLRSPQITPTYQRTSFIAYKKHHGMPIKIEIFYNLKEKKHSIYNIDKNLWFTTLCKWRVNNDIKDRLFCYAELSQGQIKYHMHIKAKNNSRKGDNPQIQFLSGILSLTEHCEVLNTACWY